MLNEVTILMASESDHKYTFSGFGDEDSPYWRKRAERLKAEAKKKEREDQGENGGN